MKTKKYIYMASLLLLMACGNTKKQAENSEENALKEQTQVDLTDEQVKKVNIEVGHLTEMVFENAIEANGKLVIDPQSEATVTPQTGGNIKQILVKEGQIVLKARSSLTCLTPTLLTFRHNIYHPSISRSISRKSLLARQ
ncbi:HlyD family secretion protein [Prevotella corporis]|uniref:HlyD family secretion protein n=1 Tax=Prevotella corporis TaxID=28128 RepID=UPI000B19D96F|nr:HlyD family secretion protein [Prevotella corporis]